MKNTKIRVFVAVIALCLGVSLFGCISPKPIENPGIAENGTIAEIEEDTESEITEESKEAETITEDAESADALDILADLLKDIAEMEISESERNKTFQGDGFTLIYSGYLWEVQTAKDHNDKDISFLTYILDETELICSGKSSMFGSSLSTKEKSEAMHKEWYDWVAQAVTEDTYISEETNGFEILKDDIFYAAFGWRRKENDELINKVYVIVSEKEDIVVSFVARLGDFTKYGPDIPIMPILRSIVFEGGNAQSANVGTYEQQVKESGDELIVSGYSIPSLSKIMDDGNISYRHAGEEKTIGKMIAPSLLNYFDEPEKVIAEIVEITYEDVGDVFGAIDIYGALLYESYGFYVTYPPSDYSSYGEDYRFCELIKRLSDEEKTVYVAAVYCRAESLIKLQFGVIETLVFDGIGPLNLERIGQESLE